MADDQPQADAAADEDAHAPPSGHGAGDEGDAAAGGDDKGGNAQGRDAKKGGGNKDADGEDEAKRKRAKPFVKIGLVVVIIGVIAGGFYLWWSTRNIETTDDAFTAGRVITVAPQVAGYVVQLDVNDNQFVREGQVLARIDPRSYQAVVDQDEAQVEQAEGQLEGSRYRVAVSRETFPAQLAQAKGQLEEAKGQEFQAETDYARQHRIARAATSQQAVDQSTAALEQARGQVAVSEAQVQAATPVKANISVTRAQVQQQSAALATAEAALATAKLNLGWTVIRAPHDGWVAQRSIEQGNYVNKGQALFSIVEPEVWITANFKETQLARIRAGEITDIHVDAYPALHLEGHVDSIQLGSGEQFSAFPPENATGNFVKIVQRVPVKIVIDSGLDPDLPLPIGLSAEPTIHLNKTLAH